MREPSWPLASLLKRRLILGSAALHFSISSPARNDARVEDMPTRTTPWISPPSDRTISGMRSMRLRIEAASV
ncbi:hypothetical protein D3C72_1686640 [compost metagenome]